MRFERKQSISKKDINAIANKVEEKHSKKRLLIILGVLLTIVIVIYLVVETNTTGKRLVEGYDTLTARKQESKSEFSKNAKKFITNPDGSITLTDSYLISQEDNDVKEDNEDANKNSSGKFAFTSGIDWSRLGMSGAKNRSFESVYNLLKQYNASDDFIAGVLGNIYCEASIGHWEKNPHCANSKSDIAKIFDANPGNGIYESNGVAGTYNDLYGNKIIGESLTLCWNEYYNICKQVAEINIYNQNPYGVHYPCPGMGSIGQTDSSYFGFFCEWMEQNNKDTDNSVITQDDLVSCDTYSIDQKHDLKSMNDEFVQNGYRGPSDKFNKAWKNMNNGQEIPKCVEASTYWLYVVEQCSDYEALGDGSAFDMRGSAAVAVYDLIRGK